MALQYPGHGIGYGQEQSLAPEDRMLSAYAAQLPGNSAHIHSGAQGQGHKPAYGFGLGGDRMPGLAYGGKDFKGSAVHLVYCEIECAKTCLHTLGKAVHDVRRRGERAAV